MLSLPPLIFLIMKQILVYQLLAGSWAGAGAEEGAGAGALVAAGAGAMLDTLMGALMAKAARMLTTQMKMARLQVAFSMKSVVFL